MTPSAPSKAPFVFCVQVTLNKAVSLLKGNLSKFCTVFWGPHRPTKDHKSGMAYRFTDISVKVVDGTES